MARVTRPVKSAGGIGREEWLYDTGAFQSDYYRYVRARVPMVGDGIGVWVDLSTSGGNVLLKGGTSLEQEQAQSALDDLNYRAYEFDYEWGSGFQRLTEMFFLSFYTNGRFCAEIVPYSDLSGISYVALVDPFSVSFKRGDGGGGKVELHQKVSGNLSSPSVPLPKDRVFYSAFEPDLMNPMGVSPLDSIKWVLEIKEKLIEDMAKASHNAGFPRIVISLDPPIRQPGESNVDYENRVNTDFDNMEEQFRDLAPDDNIFAMSNIKVDYLAAAGGQDFQWSINLDRVEGEIVAGLRLFPWLLGSSSSTTKNWVEAQHALLMQRVHRGAQHGIRFLDWVRNSHLRLMGSPVRAHQEFRPIGDPGKLLEERAKQWEFQRVDSQVTRGYISKDEGARQLGLDRAFSQDPEVGADVRPSPFSKTASDGRGVPAEGHVTKRDESGQKVTAQSLEE